MIDKIVTLRLRQRRVQLMTAGGLAMILAVAVMVAHHGRALPVDGIGDPKAFGALAVAPPPPGSPKRFGWVPRDVLARSFAPIKTATLPLAARRRALGGSALPDEESFAGPVVPIDALPLTADALALSGPGAADSTAGSPGPMFAGAGGAARSVAGAGPGAGAGAGGSGGGGGGSGGGTGGAASGSGPVATVPTPAATPTPVGGTQPAATPAPEAPTTAGGGSTTAPAAGTDPVSPIDIGYQPPTVAGPMLQPPPSDWPMAGTDPFETSETPPLADTPNGTDPIRPAVTPVPEPATWALLLLGFALVGAALRGRHGVGRPHVRSET